VKTVPHPLVIAGKALQYCLVSDPSDRGQAGCMSQRPTQTVNQIQPARLLCSMTVAAMRA